MGFPDRYVARGHTAMPASVPLARARGCRIGPVASGLPLLTPPRNKTRGGDSIRAVENASSAEGLRSRRRLWCVRTTAGIGSAAGDVRGTCGEWGGDGARGASETFSDRGVTALKVGRRAQSDTAGDAHVASPARGPGAGVGSRGSRGSSDPADFYEWTSCQAPRAFCSYSRVVRAARATTRR
jgi:hypothetical protein